VVFEDERGPCIARIWDPARLEQALSNLIANAVQHGGPEIRLFAFEQGSDDVVVSVQNGGEPIARDALATVFEAFQKGNGSPGGLGLGLFIVREIIEAHEGTVDVTSSEEGTTFSFRLPRGTAGDGGSVSTHAAGTPALPADARDG
jgi:signal transduction histidine kinase